MPLRLDLPGDTPTYRRNGLLRRQLSAQPRRTGSLDECQEHEQNFSLIVAVPTSKVPNELLDRIIELFIQGVLTSTRTQKGVFKTLIKPSTLVSKDFRFLTLRRFFHRIRFEDVAGSKALLNYLAEVDKNYHIQGWTAGYFWVRSLSSPSFLIASNAKNLNNLTHLKDLCIDFSHSSIILQRSSLENLFKALTSHATTLDLTSLMLTSLPRIDIHLLTLAAQTFPGLTNIHLSSTEGLDMTCCPNCYEDSLTRIFHSPIHEIYQDITSLANVFGKALAPLKKLSHLYMGIFLSQSDLLDLHINHGTDDDIRPITFETVYNCARCEKYRTSTKQHELLASLTLARHLGSLEYIGWSSCFGPRVADEGEKDGQEEDNIEGDANHGDVASHSFLKALASDPKLQKEGQSKLYKAHNFKTGLAIHRAAGKIKITRML